ncbi:MAG: alcohol dehydrogenase catalytic domain-containing protein [Planctomycetota bacterium]|nr:alcohol dehydrogenase catalytic domain-containing protein [Planctomycetota bacterium]
MKALVVTAPGWLEIRDIPAPKPGPYDALVRIEWCGICNSTDHKLLMGQMSWAPPCPFVLGHEAAGTVLEVGPHVRKYKPGDVVTRPMAFWPGSRPGMNIAIGGFAEYGLVRDVAAMAADGDKLMANDYTSSRQVVVPKGLSTRDAALAISLSETASALRHLPHPRGLTILVAVKLAQELLAVLKPGGFASAYGAPAAGQAYPPGWQNAQPEEHLSLPWVAGLLARGWVKPEWFVTHTWEFAQVIEAIGQAQRGDVLKGLVRISRSGTTEIRRKT